MSERADSERLKDIQEAIQRIESYVSGMSYEDFLDDSKTQDNGGYFVEWACGADLSADTIEAR
jgi:uncharacterized protein with HEPN domain